LKKNTGIFEARNELLKQASEGNVQQACRAAVQLRELDPGGFREWLTKAKGAALAGNHHEVASKLQLHEIAYENDPLYPSLPPRGSEHVDRQSSSESISVTFRPLSRRPPPLDLGECENGRKLRTEYENRRKGRTPISSPPGIPK
jgi:hypothetical protein